MSDPIPYSGTYTVVGPPGCGKTTFLARQIEAILDRTHTPFGTVDATPAIVCSLTRTAAREVVRKCGDLAVKLDDRCIGTLHAHAYRSLGCPPVMDDKAIGMWNEQFPMYALGEIAVDPDEPDWEEGATQRGPGDDVREAYDLLRSRQVDPKLYPPHIDIFARRWVDFKKQTDRIDFCDMIEMALDSVDAAPGDPQVILADEAQDHSRLEFALLRKWAEAADAMIVVGDAYQALYTWRGAAPEMLLPADTDPARFRVLSQSYRVPQTVHAVASRWISRIRDYRPLAYRPRLADPSDADSDPVLGNVRRSTGTSAEPSPIIDEALRLLDTTNDEDRPRTVMITASCSYLLQPLISELRGAGVPFSNPWRTRRGDWNPLGGGRGVTMAQRLLSLLAIDPQTTGADRLWTWDELRNWTAAAKAEGLLVRGAKNAIVKQAEADPYGMPDFATLSELIVDDRLIELWDWMGGRSSVPPTADLRWLCDWYGSRLSPAREKAGRYPLRVLSDRGVEAIRKPPRLHVGTIHCSPADELVLTITGWVPMGELDPDVHRLIGFNPRCNYLTQGRNSPGMEGAGYRFKIGRNHYAGSMLTMTTSTSRTRVTPDHRMRVRFSEAFYNKWVVYLMRRGDWWRIGMCTSGRMPYQAGGIPGRLASEKGDAGWILGVYESRREALIAEVNFQCNYGIPSLCFESYQTRAMTTRDLHDVHESMKCETGKRAAQLLIDIGKFIDAPLYIRDGKVRKRNAHWFETVAANVIGEYMMLPTIEGTKVGAKRSPASSIVTVTREQFNGDVFSLAVEPFEHYVSGGAVVHNSFKGAEADSVFVMPDLSPAGWRDWGDETSGGRDSVTRTFYVAMTRSREELILCEPASTRTVDL